MTRAEPRTPVTRLIEAEEGARILALRKKRKGLAEIARLTGRTSRGISKYLDRQGIPRTRSPIRGKTSHRGQRIAELALQGLSEREVARKLRLTSHQVTNTTNRCALFTGHSLSTTQDLARETGLSRTSIVRLIERGELDASRWFRLHAFTQDQFEVAVKVIAATYISPEQAKGWLSSAQAARELSMGVDNLLSLLQQGDARVSGIVRRRVAGMSGQVWRYETATVLAAAKGLPQRNLPLEYNRPLVLRVEDVAAIVHRSHDAVTVWAQNGAPHLRDRTGRCGRIWFHLPTLLTWLEEQPHVNYQRAAASLGRHLTVAQQVAS